MQVYNWLIFFFFCKIGVLEKIILFKYNYCQWHWETKEVPLSFVWDFILCSILSVSLMLNRSYLMQNFHRLYFLPKKSSPLILLFYWTGKKGLLSCKGLLNMAIFLTTTHPKIDQVLVISAVLSEEGITSSSSSVMNRWASSRLCVDSLSAVCDLFPCHGVWSQCQLSQFVCACSLQAWVQTDQEHEEALHLLKVQ